MSILKMISFFNQSINESIINLLFYKLTHHNSHMDFHRAINFSNSINAANTPPHWYHVCHSVECTVPPDVCRTESRLNCGFCWCWNNTKRYINQYISLISLGKNYGVENSNTLFNILFLVKKKMRIFNFSVKFWKFKEN